MVQDHYETLGVRPGASSDEIEAAWRRAVNFWHPDRNKSREAAERLKQANLAREVLLDDEQRRRYDRSLAYSASGQTPAGVSQRMDPPAGYRETRHGRGGASRSGTGAGGQGDAADRSDRMGAPRAPSGGGAGRAGGPTDFDDDPMLSGNEDVAPARRFSFDWWRRLARDTFSKNILVGDDQQVITLFDRRPKFARFVLVPMGIMAIVLAALFTVLVV